MVATLLGGLALIAVGVGLDRSMPDASAVAGSPGTARVRALVGSIPPSSSLASPDGAPPTTAPSTTIPKTTATTAPLPEPKRRIVINGVGDVSLDPNYIPALASNGYEHALSGLDGLFLEDDLTVINLECPVSTVGIRVPKQFNFRCDTAALPIVRDLGVDVANQGNNHVLDYGPEAMLDSIANIEAAGIIPVGVGVDADAAHRAAIIEIGGWTVAVVGFGGVIPAGNWLAGPDHPGMADGDTIETMTAAVAEAARQADLVVVTIHWGVELQSGPPSDDVARAHAMIEAGADIIFGHHPHRLNSLEVHQGKPIAWSLGNFVWPRLSAAGSDSAVAQAIVEPDGTITACLLDVTIVSDGHPTLDDPTRRTCEAG